MFTGIITGVGRITRIEDLGASQAHGKRLHVQCPAGYLDDAGLGDSIAINGACMTVTTLQQDAQAPVFTLDISAESLDKTAGLDTVGEVNLEKALRANDRLGGHLVSGHVDGMGEVQHFAPVGESWELRILAPQALAKYWAYKGSITVNGVSLTVNRVNPGQAPQAFGALQPGKSMSMQAVAGQIWSFLNSNGKEFGSYRVTAAPSQAYSITGN